MAATSYVIDLIPSTGSTGPGPDIQLPGPARDFGLYFLEAVAAWAVDIQISPDGVNWVTVTAQSGSVPGMVALQDQPTAWIRANVTSLASGTLAVKAVYLP